MIISEHDLIFAMGDNHAGQLGLSPAEARRKANPTLIESLQKVNKVLSVHAGGDNSYAITCGSQEDMNSLYSWGSHKSGLLGKDIQTIEDPYHVPSKVVFDDQEELKISKFSSSASHCVLLSSDDNKVFVWGDNSKGQLGLNHLN